MKKNKNKYYSDEIPIILEKSDRLRIAKQIGSVIRDYTSTKNLVCLDVGCSSGIITNYLKKDFKKIFGVDVDKKAIIEANRYFRSKKIQFTLVSSEKLPYQNNKFDFVICHQVYNFVNNPEKLIDEIYRVLKPGGLCYFSGRNKFGIIEPQYKLPFLSWMPHSLGTPYLKLLRRGSDFFGKNYLSYFELLKLLNKFIIIDYTIPILKNPKKYGFNRIPNIGLLAKAVGPFLLPVVPNYIFILKKPIDSDMENDNIDI